MIPTHQHKKQNNFKKSNPVLTSSFQHHHSKTLIQKINSCLHTHFFVLTHIMRSQRLTLLTANIICLTPNLINAGFFGGNSPVLVEQTDTILGSNSRPPVQQYNYLDSRQNNQNIQLESQNNGIPQQASLNNQIPQINTQYGQILPSNNQFQNAQSQSNLAVRQVGQNDQEAAANALMLANAQREAVMAQMNLVNTTTTTTTTTFSTSTTPEPTSSTAVFDANAANSNQNNIDLSGVNMSENANDTQKLTDVFAQDARTARISEYNTRVAFMEQRRQEELARGYTNWTEKVLTMKKEDFQKSPPLGGKIVIFNQIFRCAGKYLNQILKDMKRLNGINVEIITDKSSETQHQQFIGTIDDILTKTSAADASKPIVIAKNHQIFDMGKYNRPNPAWITFIRHPVAQYASEWYCTLKYGK